MEILDTHVHTLRFDLHKDAPDKYIKKWKDFKEQCESGNNSIIVEQLKNYCKLDTNKNLPYLIRVEGGLGGQNNSINKQIRFRHFILSDQERDNDIILHEITSTDNEKWTYDELDDLLISFLKTANLFMNSECVNGHIQMFNRKMLNENYE
tara:strand:- start:1655 stop:2107 length:453 start_codon:yes stop_codon:yes gene_type:complete